MAVSVVSPGKLWRRPTYGDLESGKSLNLVLVFV